MKQRSCAVMQPTYLSWSGYYNLICNSDVFIFLDDVQYSKNSFANRNKYPVESKEGFKWLTVPVSRTSLSQKICETMVLDENNWRKKHLTTLHHKYLRHPYYKDFFPVIGNIIENTSLQSLSELNIQLVKEICGFLNIKKEFYKSSELGVEGERCDRLLKFCHRFECEKYLSPIGAKEYIVEDGILLESDVEVSFQVFESTEYKQFQQSLFQPYMSIVDLIFNLGRDESIDYIARDIQ